MSTHPKAFVLMPFDPEFDAIYNDLIKPALEDAGYEVSRADSFLDQQSILRDIIRGIASAHLIIADLTTLNPNVLYELGLCHGLRIPTILLAQSIEEVPFDLRPYRIQVYSTLFDKVHKLKEALKEIGRKHQAKKITFGSPISDFLPGDYILKEKAQEKSAKESLGKTPEEVEEEKGFIDFIIDGNQSAKEIERIMANITKETEGIGNKMKYHTSCIKKLVNNPGPGTPLKARKISLATAKDISRYSEKIEKEFPTLGNNIDILIESHSSYITLLQPKTEEAREEISKFRQTITGLLGGTRVALKGICDYRDSIKKLRGISREINRASRRLIHALDDIISLIEKVEAFCARTIPLIDEKLENQYGAQSNNST